MRSDGGETLNSVRTHPQIMQTTNNTDSCSKDGSCSPCSRGLCPGTILLSIVLLIQGGIALFHWILG